jgi:hypothetical protein
MLLLVEREPLLEGCHLAEKVFSARTAVGDGKGRANARCQSATVLFAAPTPVPRWEPCRHHASGMLTESHPTWRLHSRLSCSAAGLTRFPSARNTASTAPRP